MQNLKPYNLENMSPKEIAAIPKKEAAISNCSDIIEQMNNSTQAPKSQKICKLKYPTKVQIFIETLIGREKSGLNTYEANSIYNDTCLHTSVSSLQRKYGIVLTRKKEDYINLLGRKSRVTRYWLQPEDLNKAKRLVNELRLENGFAPLYAIDHKGAHHDFA